MDQLLTHNCKIILEIISPGIIASIEEKKNEKNEEKKIKKKNCSNMQTQKFCNWPLVHSESTNLFGFRLFKFYSTDVFSETTTLTDVTAS